MKSKSKPAQTKLEREYVRLLAQQPCVVCGQYGVEIHEPGQGLWFASMPLCPPCHRGPKGFHGDRQRWTLHKMDEIKAINKAVKAAVNELTKRTHQPRDARRPAGML